MYDTLSFIFSVVRSLAAWIYYNPVVAGGLVVIAFNVLFYLLDHVKKLIK